VGADFTGDAGFFVDDGDAGHGIRFLFHSKSG
jgi:hypothetical protein